MNAPGSGGAAQALAAHFDYQGPPALRQPVADALAGVVDPELALGIVDLGLVYGVHIDDEALHLRLTMTSAACPMADLIVDDAAAALQAVLPPTLAVDIELVWEPPWTPQRLSPHARRFLGG